VDLLHVAEAGTDEHLAFDRMPVEERRRSRLTVASGLLGDGDRDRWDIFNHQVVAGLDDGTLLRG
jgi:hypothetical protein